MRQSRFFSDYEFWCRCGRAECDAPREVTQGLLDVLDALRDDVGQPLRVTSGLRCDYWNKRGWGAPDSGHLDGTEADLLVNTSALRHGLLASAYRHGVRRLGIGATFIHVGVSARLPQDVAWTYYRVTLAAAILDDDPRSC